VRDDLKIQVADRMLEPGFKHVTGRLKDGDAFCALGVVADIAVAEGLGRWLPSDQILDPKTFHFRSASLPERIREWAGVSAAESFKIHFFNDTHPGDPAAVADFIKNEL
jgi:hypothetical protein